MITCARFHDFCAGHRVVGHEGKCKNLHGHNYRVHFICTGKSLDNVGRIIDFSSIKVRLCDWLEINWDHKMLIWEKDYIYGHLAGLDQSVVRVPFNPTAENMANYLLHTIGPKVLADVKDVKLIEVIVEETRKCSATARLKDE